MSVLQGYILALVAVLQIINVAKSQPVGSLASLREEVSAYLIVYYDYLNRSLYCIFLYVQLERIDKLAENDQAQLEIIFEKQGQLRMECNEVKKKLRMRNVPFLKTVFLLEG